MYGHALLQASAERAAREWTFIATKEAGRPTKIVGLLIFVFEQ
jgi:hypothetical protein